MAEKSGHPAIRDTFIPHSIRGKKPAHADHGMSKGGGNYEEGGPTGFNHQDDFGGHDASIPSQHHEGGTFSGSEEHGDGVQLRGNATEGGQDFTVPPHRSRK